ncbi:hypothetical protein D3C78_1172690 [compost metagenome]
MPEHHAGRFFLGVEQVQALADLAVIALLRLFQAVQVILEVLLAAPAGTVDALQHLVLRVATPVGAGHLHQLEGLQLAGRGHVRPTAQVDEVTLPVEGQLLITGNRLDDLDLVLLTQPVEEGHRLIARHQRATDLMVGLGQLVHLRLDLLEILTGEGTLAVEVVIEAVVDDRADGDLGTGEQLLHGHGHQVGTGVAQHLDTLRIPRSDDRQRGITLDDVRGIHQLAVDLAGQSGLGQTGTDGLRNFGHADRLLERTLTTVGKSNDGHGASSLSGDPYQRPRGVG